MFYIYIADFFWGVRKQLLTCRMFAPAREYTLEMPLEIKFFAHTNTRTERGNKLFFLFLDAFHYLN